MEDFYSRREIMKRFFISRRVIEGYEEIGLIKSAGHDEKGGLLYDYSTVCRIGFIRLCQKLGFKLKDITAIIDLPAGELKVRLAEQIKVTRRQMEDFGYLLEEICSLVTAASDPRNSERIFEIFKEERF